MGQAMDPIREEHRHLLPHIESLRRGADLAPGDEARKAAEEAHRFLVEHLLPHAKAEDRVLYPAVEEAMGAPGAAATMSRDHLEVETLTRDLGELLPRVGGDHGDAAWTELRRILYGLHALVTVHFAKEEEIYLPLLDARMNVEEGERIVHEMHGEHG